MNFRAIRIMPLFFLLISCDNQIPEKKTEDTSTSQQVESTAVVQQQISDGKTLALVNGSAITEQDLDFAIRKLIGEEGASRMDDKARKKVLESMVMSRAISHLRQKELNQEEKLELTREVEAYKEQLLAYSYLLEHGSPSPVTIEEIEDYYSRYPEQFGAKSFTEYEMITTKRPLQPGERDFFLELLKDPEKRADWRGWSDELGASGIPVVYRRGRDEKSTLHPKLAQTLTALRPGKVSSLLLVQEMPYFLRVIDRREIPPRPLSEVAETIRKLLAPAQVKRSIEAVGKEALAQAVVEYR